MSTYLLPEAALRSLAMGVIILAALRVLRIDQVRARRTAWLLALAGALAMPLLVGAHIGPRLLPDISIAGSELQAQPIAAHYDGVAVPWSGIIDPRAAAIEGVGQRNARLTSYAVSICAVGYCIVAAVLSLRLGAGVGFALRLRKQAQRLDLAFDPHLDVRVSSRIGTPVTIASTVLLPPGFASWDASTLRVVLAHERAHVLQRDFLVHLLAGLHCAIFWFNPFSWWLQRQLAELGEALSDHSAVGQAESRASYAEVLLAFACAVRSPFAGVAMANCSNLTPRIERLLSDQGYERSFATKRRMPFIAAGVVLLAMVVSTSMSRVDAATGAESGNTDSNPSASASTADANASNSAANTSDNEREDRAAVTRDEGVLVIRSGQSKISIDSGNRLPTKAGDYIYFQHNGKPYLIQDPSILSRAQSLLAPMEDLGRQEKDLAKQRTLLGTQQRELIAQQRLIKIDSPDFRREVAELESAAKQMRLAEVSQIDEKLAAQLQSHLAEIQSRVDALQTDLARREGSFGEKEGSLGELESKLAEQISVLAEQRHKIVESARRELRPLIEQAIRDGKGTQLSTATPP